MRVQRSSKAALFLIELIIAIVFFALASATCVQLFATARQLSISSSDLSMAINLAQSAAEEFKAAPESTYPDDPGGVATVYYDGDGKQVSDSRESVYRVSRTYSLYEPMKRAEIAVWKTGADQALYKIEVQKYMPERTE